MPIPSAITERSRPTEINARRGIRALAFSANSEYLWSGGQDQNVEVWRVEDGQRVKTIEAWYVLSLAASRDGRWTVGGTRFGQVFFWNADTFSQAWTHAEDASDISDVDFSPDSSRLVSASWNCTATVWNLAGNRLQTLNHKDLPVVAAKFSPQGNRIATATWSILSIWVWNSDNGDLIANFPVTVNSYLKNSPLVWLQDYLFVVCGSTIQQLDASTGSVVSEWPVPGGDEFSCLAVPKHGQFIAYSGKHTTTFWDASTHTQLALIEHDEDIRSMALSTGDRFLTIGLEDGKVVVESLPRLMESMPLFHPHSVFQEPDIQINDSALDAWKDNQLENAEKLLTIAIRELQHPARHLLAARALIRARLERWNEALADAEMAIDIQPSVIAYLAKSVAHAGKDERDAAYRACDIAIEHFRSSHVTLLLLTKAITVFQANEHSDAMSRMDDLIATIPSNSTCCTVKAYMHLLQGVTQREQDNHEYAVQSFERARAQLRYYSKPLPPVVPLMSGWKFDDLPIKVRQHLCEALYAAGRRKDASTCLLDLVHTFRKDIDATVSITDWVSDFAQQCLSMGKHNTDALSHVTFTPLLKEWASSTLSSRGWRDALVAASSFTLPRVDIYRVVCEHLEKVDQVTHAVECFHLMLHELGEANGDQRMQWTHDFRQNCFLKLERLGDAAVVAQQHETAISHYTVALSLSPTYSDVLVKRSTARLATGSWQEALDDADRLIELDASSPCGYQMKHAALHKGKDYDNAIRAFETMLSRMEESPDPNIQRYRHKYVDPLSTKVKIQEIVQEIVPHLPRVLINVDTGLLCDRSGQAYLFESSDAFKELVSSTIIRKRHAVRLKHEVRKRFRYVMFSHKWQVNEPGFEQVANISVYDLASTESFPTHDKLKRFCRIAQNRGFHWAWSDTCCIQKSDPTLRQEALLSMFKWYQGCALMIVFLLDVPSPFNPDIPALAKSVWNTRGWTLQEYIAAKVIHFYTKGWTPYLPLDRNHKLSPEVLNEMHIATGLPQQRLEGLFPGLSSIREKLRLASTRKTTEVEDAAYSLFGIFSVTTIHMNYGEREGSLGRLLSHVLARSGDLSILAWTGVSSEFNSCLPSQICVFDKVAMTHLPEPIPDAEMERMITSSPPSFSLDVALRLYDCLNNLPFPTFSDQWMKLPCIAFPLPPSRSLLSRSSRHVYRFESAHFGTVEIKTKDDLSKMQIYYLIHPWRGALLEHEARINVAVEDSAPLPSPTVDDEEASEEEASDDEDPEEEDEALDDTLPPLPSELTLQHAPPMDRHTQARRLVAHLGQEFGAILLAASSKGVRTGFRRVAADCLIRVRFQRTVSLNDILDNVRTLDVF